MYRAYLEEGFHQGRRDELNGGWLIRSLGEWSELPKHVLKGRQHLKNDERILGDSHFVAGVLTRVEEKFNRKYELNRFVE